MIDKANIIYDRWSAGHELPTPVALGPIISDDECDSTNEAGGSGISTGNLHVDHYGQYGARQQQQADSDPFARFHPILVQCVVEIHQRAKSLLTSRKSSQLPSWGPTPVIRSPCSPVLPPEVPEFVRVSYSQNELGNGDGSGYNGMTSSSSSLQSYSSDIEIQASYGTQGGEPMFYSDTTLPPPPQWPPSTLMALSHTSKMAIDDTINFELGALNSNSDQNWMAFF